MEATNEIAEFRHDPFPDPNTYIRLLKVLSVVPTRDVPVHCEISTWPCHDAPDYNAISYTWGEVTPFPSILVDGKRMDVRLNCEYILRQASPHVGDGYLWVDAICINQSDNDEKSAQVARMGDVFKMAVQVFACVGQHGDDSEFLYSMSRTNEPLFRSWTTAVCRKGNLSLSSIRYYPRLVTWKFKARKSTIARLENSFLLFLKQPYFQRVWIYQELFLAQNTSVLCGEDNIPISRIWMTCLILYAELSWDKAAFKLEIWCQRPYEIKAFEVMLQAGATNQQPIQLATALRTALSLQCLNPRDRVYGILSIIDWAGRKPVRPDYSKDRYDLAIQVLESFDHSHVGVLRYQMYITKIIAEALDLLIVPSQRLNDALQSRMIALTNLETTSVTSPKRFVKRKHMKDSILAGMRLSFREGAWRFQQHLAETDTPRMKYWNESPDEQRKSRILLPPEAQHGDWLLLSDITWRFFQKQYEMHIPIAFVARDCDSAHFELVGKALLREPQGWPHNFMKLFKNLNSSFKVYMDADDLFCLLHSCSWKAYFFDADFTPDVIKRYFHTRLCGEKYSSWAEGRGDLNAGHG